MNTPKAPALFVGHGNPMHTLSDNRWTRAWRALGATLPKPRAVLCISAHWYGPGTAVSAAERPETIHDFYGFPSELYTVHYPAPGDSALAARIREMLTPLPVVLDEYRGLDHGAWTVLRHLFPDADVPVVQLSIDAMRPAAFHYELGSKLAPLREEGVMLVGSGNVVHNLRRMRWVADAPAYDWAERFEAFVRERIARNDHGTLIEYQLLGEDARLAVPTPDHYLPLLYVLGARAEAEPAAFPIAGIDGGSISMLSVLFRAE